MTFNSNKINLPKFAMIKLGDKFKIRCMIKREPLLFHIILKQEFTWSPWLPTLKKLYETT